ncbi:MAG: putative bifunctional diguanylate cyclase/phosphodiesterase [Actinomycetes bacterium]
MPWANPTRTPTSPELVVEHQEPWSADPPWSAERSAEGFFHIDVRPLADGYVVQGRVTTEHRREQLVAEVVQSSTDAIVVADLEGRITLWSRAAEQMYGWTEDEVLGQHISVLATDAERDAQSQLWTAATAGRPSGPVDVVRQTKGGKMLDLELWVVPLQDERGRTVGAMSVQRSAAETAALRRAAAHARRRLAEVMDAVPVSIGVLSTVTDATGDVVDFIYEQVNAAFCELVGEVRETLLGNSLLDLYPSHLDLGLFDAYRQVVQTGDPFVAELPWFEERNLAGYLEVKVMKFNDGIIATGRDVTDRKLLEEDLSNEALTDPLTGLGNRRMLIERIRHDLARLDREEGELAVLFLDLDHFKDVNDTQGHDVGDLVLQEVARRLLQELRPADTVARLGGDEFVIVLPRAHTVRDPATVAQRLLDSVSQPIAVGSVEVRLGGSIGITTSQGDDDAENLVRQADLAMYRAKRRSGDRFEFFDDQISEEVHDRVTTQQALRAAVEHDEFEPWFQPEVDLRTGRIVGFEALARWHTNGTVVPAVDWVGHAESAGLMTRLDRAVQTKACAMFAGWSRPGLRALVRLWLNVSARELIEAGTAAVLLATVRQAGLQASDVGVEITETALVADPAAANANIEQLVDAGVRIAVDDFGTGFASLASLRDLKVDTIKIDRSFTKGVPGDEFDDAVVAATVALSDSLELGIAGEGIETEAQRVALAELGCTTGQGYLFSPPLPGDDAAKLLSAGSVGAAR